MALPTIGVAMYNGYTFNSTTETLDFRITPVPDSAGRTFPYSNVSLTLTTIIAGRPSDAEAQQALSALTQPAAGLIYNGRGTSGININLGGMQDVQWGPKPRVVQFKPLGGGNAVRLTWTVEFCVPTCGDAVTANVPMEFNYQLTWDIDKSGYTKRTYKGFIRIPQTRRDATNRIPYISADQFRESINPAPVPGYRRIPGSFTLSEDKCRLDFSIVDEQMGPNIPPSGVVEVEASHQYASQPGQFFRWTGTFDASYEVARGIPVSAAVKSFELTLRDRLTQLASGVPTIIPSQFTAAETQIYDKTKVSLSMSYIAVASGNTLADSLKAILNFGGLWRPVPDSNWRQWITSFDNGSRGISRMVFSPGEDRIIDLCGRQLPKTVDVELRADRFAPPAPIQTELKNTFPPPVRSKSWIDYVQTVRVEEDHGNVIVKTLPPAPLMEVSLSAGSGVWNVGSASLPYSPDQSVFPPANDMAFKSGGRLDTETANTNVQSRTSPTVYLYLTGSAVRAGFPIPVPELQTVNDKAVTPCNREGMGEGFEQSIVGNAIYPIYAAKWNMRYVMNDQSGNGTLPIPRNFLAENF